MEEVREIQGRKAIEVVVRVHGFRIDLMRDMQISSMITSNMLSKCRG
jgi:hypothetical protein